MKPLFIFSLPRSGSTLLQRMLCMSNEVSSSAEPWVLLPYLYTLRSEGAASEYCHRLAFRAISDFYKGFPNGREDYLEALRDYVLTLYSKRTANQAAYFLDKTPRYHLICKEIIDLFPEGKFIFLWRNPLAVVASILKSWTKGRWKLQYHKIDLYAGLANLINTLSERKSMACAVQYETLLLHPTRELRRICQYLEIDFNDRMVSSFSKVHFDGWMGDRLGMKTYNQIHCGSIDAWKKTFNNPFRRYWAKSYLNWIGDDRLSIMGYRRREIASGLRTSHRLEGASMLHDLLFAGFYHVYSKIDYYRQHYKNGRGYVFF